MKTSIKDLKNAYRYLYPRLTVIVSCGTMESPNALTIAWSTPLSMNPPLIGVSIAEKRYSHKIISKGKNFVVNIPNISQVKETHNVGSVSGATEPDKIKNSGFTIEASHKVESPRIRECQVCLECELKDIITTGDHDLFIGEVIEISAEKDIIDPWGIDIRSFKPIYWRRSKFIEETFTLDIKKDTGS
ncbi:MAG: flavin reductase family protein [Candidatus Hodarchaeales archaeon]